MMKMMNHLQHAQQYHVTGREGFVQAGQRIASLLSDTGFTCVPDGRQKAAR